MAAHHNGNGRTPQHSQDSQRISNQLEYSPADKYANALVPTSAMGIALRSTCLEREYGVPKASGPATIITDYGTDIAGSFLPAMPCLRMGTRVAVPRILTSEIPWKAAYGTDIPPPHHHERGKARSPRVQSGVRHVSEGEMY